MNQYQVILEAEIYVTVDAVSREEAESKAEDIWTMDDVEVLGVTSVDQVAGEEQ